MSKETGSDLHLRYAERRAARAYWLAVGSFALMSKFITANLPGILVLLDIYPLRRLGGATGWLTPRNAVRLAREAALRGALTLQRGRGYLGHRKRWRAEAARRPRSPGALGSHLAKTLWPMRLSPLYELTLPVHPLEARFVWARLASPR